MDYLQYVKDIGNKVDLSVRVLNLIINGLPSIFTGTSFR